MRVTGARAARARGEPRRTACASSTACVSPARAVSTRAHGPCIHAGRAAIRMDLAAIDACDQRATRADQRRHQHGTAVSPKRNSWKLHVCQVRFGMRIVLRVNLQARPAWEGYSLDSRALPAGELGCGSMKAPIGTLLGLAVYAMSSVASAQWQPAAQPGAQQAPPGQYQAPASPYAPAAPYNGQGDAERTLQQADQQDSGRGLQWVWLNGEIGFQDASLQGFKSHRLLDGVIVKDSASGVTYGGAVGVRVIALTLGVHFRYGNFSEWDLWSLGLEGGFHIPLGRLEPYVTLGAGYSKVGALRDKAITASVRGTDVNIDGFNARIGGGLDYYITPRLSAGASLSGDFMGLYRSQVSGITPAGAGVYGSKGSSLGFALSACANIGLHF